MTKHLGQQVLVSTEYGPRPGIVVDILPEVHCVVMTRGIFPHKWELHICDPSHITSAIHCDFDQMNQWYYIYKTGKLYGVTPIRAYLSESPMITAHHAASAKPVVPIHGLHIG
jgi:hypothetical protein